MTTGRGAELLSQRMYSAARLALRDASYGVSIKSDYHVGSWDLTCSYFTFSEDDLEAVRDPRSAILTTSSNQCVRAVNT